MKSKLMIALAVLALVFGMALTACDDGAAITMDPGSNNTILDDLGSTNSDHVLTGPSNTTSNTDVGNQLFN